MLSCMQTIVMRLRKATMLEQEFVAILRCVETGSELRLLDEPALAKLNTAITDGQVRTRVGHPGTKAATGWR